MIRIQINFKYIDQFSPDFDADLYKWANNLLNRGLKRYTIGNITYSELNYLNVPEFDMLMTQDYKGTGQPIEDADVMNWYAWVKIPIVNLDDLIPHGLPNRMKKVLIDNTDLENPIYEDQVKTWREWAQPDDRHKIEEIDGNAYFGSYYCMKSITVIERGKAKTITGVALTGDELVIIYNSAATLINNQDVPRPVEEV